MIRIALAAAVSCNILACATLPALAGPLDFFRRDDVVEVQSQGTVADLVARVQRLEGENRVLTGQVQELQNAVRRMAEDFRKYRDDTEFRLQAVEGGKPGAPPKPRTEVQPQAPRDNTALAPGAGAPPTTLGTLNGDGAGDIIANDQPTPGDMAAVGTYDDGSAVAGDPNAPMQLPRYEDPTALPAPGQRPASGLTPPGLPGVAVDTSRPALQAQPQAHPETQMAALPASPEDEYTANYRLIEGRNYEAAELAFQKFVKAYPSDKRVPDSIHWIGESLFQRQQYRDAAEQFLIVTTKYGSYRRAPASMLRLGMSLAAMGEKDAACATFQEIGRKYPSAGTAVKGGVERETAKNGC